MNGNKIATLFSIFYSRSGNTCNMIDIVKQLFSKLARIPDSIENPIGFPDLTFDS